MPLGFNSCKIRDGTLKSSPCWTLYSEIQSDCHFLQIILPVLLAGKKYILMQISSLFSYTDKYHSGQDEMITLMLLFTRTVESTLGCEMQKLWCCRAFWAKESKRPTGDGACKSPAVKSVQSTSDFYSNSVICMLMEQMPIFWLLFTYLWGNLWTFLVNLCAIQDIWAFP